MHAIRISNPNVKTDTEYKSVRECLNLLFIFDKLSSLMKKIAFEYFKKHTKTQEDTQRNI